VFVENYWNTGSPVAQERYLDNLVVSTQRIGCLAARARSTATLAVVVGMGLAARPRG
jgi:hypothetical protein